MTAFHVHARVVSKGQTRGGGRGYAAYVERLQMDRSEQYSRYVADGILREDLVESGSQLPHWAEGSSERFWAAADLYERGPYTNTQGKEYHSVLYREYQFTLPRDPRSPTDLTLAREIAQDLREGLFSQHAVTWGLHAPLAKDGKEGALELQPHLHLMLSPRKEQPGREYGSAREWFVGKGKALKDRLLEGRDFLTDLRHEAARIYNAAFERAGLALAVTADKLRTLGITREPLHYHDHAPKAYDEEREQIRTQQAHVRDHDHPRENQRMLEAWEHQKQREGIHDLSREAMVERAREYLWRHDDSPARVQERTQDQERAQWRELERGVDRLSHQREPAYDRSHEHERQDLELERGGLSR